jgi:hypothetical protein
MLMLALVFAVLSLAANLFAAALTALFGEELMAGFFALAALLSGVAIALGYDDVMPLRTRQAAEAKAAAASDTPANAAAPAKITTRDQLYMLSPIAPPMLSSVAAFLS